MKRFTLTFVLVCVEHCGKSIFIEVKGNEIHTMKFSSVIELNPDN